MMKDIDFRTCPPRGTELDILWKAYLTSEDGFVLKLIRGDKSRHALIQSLSRSTCPHLGTTSLFHNGVCHTSETTYAAGHSGVSRLEHFL